MARKKALTSATFIPFDTASGMTQYAPSSTDKWADTILWGLWDTVGELHFATTFLARQVGRVRWNVTIDGEPLDDDKSDAEIANITSPLGPRIIAEQMALHFQVPGRFWYLNFADRGWDVYASADPDIKKLKAQSVFDILGITRHPLDKKRPDSPVRANVATIQELALLQAQHRGQAITRIIQHGILLIPNDVDFEGDFKESFKKSLQEAIKDPSSPAGSLPHVIDFPSEFIEKWRWMIPEFPYDAALPEKIEAVTRRLALGLDMPPEALLGIGNLTHWSQWAVQEQTYRAHTEPLADKVGFVLAKAIMATREGSVVTVKPDPTPLLAKVGNVVDALEAYDRGIVNADFVAALMGAQEDDRGDGVPLNTTSPRIRRFSEDRDGQPSERPMTNQSSSSLVRRT